ncbi:putative enzyme related to lactoylglutathione lyase [Geodermatophilus bullaregiensis]|uniref:VOC family protein n=1 Tax=Geodermatophilus bullaregiensis TaxID=1564160 RepID=UPI0027DBC817|nr:VOC family protein [Geodermatophilus bullaregiensis]MBM7804305.1 putative enzyme related to lactoylglutathione lyase [Geodermatophilus bullaregiensis]
MPSSVQAMLVTRDVERLVRFYADVAGAVPTDRVPDDGPVFYQGLRIGTSDVGIVADADVAVGSLGRVLLSIEVDDVDAALPRVLEHGGTAPDAPNDMPWGQRVAHVRDPDGNPVNLTTTQP